MEYENLKNTKVAGQFLVKTTPVWLSENRILLICAASNTTTHLEVSLLLSDLDEVSHKRLFHLARQNKSLQVLQGGIIEKSTHRFIAFEKADNLALRQLESDFAGNQIDELTNTPTLPSETTVLGITNKQHLPIWVWIALGTLLIVILVLLVFILSPL